MRLSGVIAPSRAILVHCPLVDWNFRRIFMALANDDKMTVISNDEMPPSRPGTLFLALVLAAVAGIGYLVFWPSISASLGW